MTERRNAGEMGREHMNEKKIPLTIGITGHLNPRMRDTLALRDAVKRELTKLRTRCPHTPMVMLCSLAQGADLLCAEAAEEVGVSLRAVLPMEQAVYEKDFEPKELARLRWQLERAQSVITIPAEAGEAEEKDRDALFRQAGLYITEHSHILLALWDGKTENQSDCGTAAMVDAALRGAWKPQRGMACRRAENLAVIHVLTPREGSADPDTGTVNVLGGWKELEEILKRTEEFNRLAETAPEGGESLLPETESADPVMKKQEAVMQAADSLSLRFARGYRQTMGILAVLGTAVALTFLLYDEANLTWMILLCGIALLAAMVTLNRAKRSDRHRRYIEYRMLAEALRVQLFLRYAGSRTETQRIMTWTEQQETPWILCAMCALNAGRAPEQIRDIRECWVEKQRLYHEKAGQRTEGKSMRNDRLLHLAGICAVVLYFGGILFELLCGGLTPHPVLPVRNADVWRTALKVLLGTVSVGTLFLASYYGKMSLERKKADHGKMEAFFRTVGAQMDRFGQTEELMELLAREELTENGNWSSYQRDNAPELNI